MTRLVITLAFIGYIYGCASSPHTAVKRQPEISLNDASSPAIIALNTKVDFVDVDTNERMEADSENDVIKSATECGVNVSIFLYENINLPNTQVIPIDCNHYLLDDIYLNISSYLGGYLSDDSKGHIHKLCDSSSTHDILISHLIFKVGHEFFYEPIFGNMSPNTNSTIMKFSLISCEPIKIKWRAQLLLRGAADLEELKHATRLLFY